MYFTKYLSYDDAFGAFNWEVSRAGMSVHSLIVKRFVLCESQRTVRQGLCVGLHEWPLERDTITNAICCILFPW